MKKIIFSLLIVSLFFACEKDEEAFHTQSNDNSLKNIAIKELESKNFNIFEETNQAILNLKHSKQIETLLNGEVTLNFLIHPKATLLVDDEAIIKGHKIRLTKKDVSPKEIQYTKDIVIVAENKDKKTYKLVIKLIKDEFTLVTPELTFNSEGPFYYVILGHSPTLPLKGVYEGAEAGVISYKSSKPEKISIDNTGKLTLKGIGISTITVKQQKGIYNHEASATIKVFCINTSAIRDFTVVSSEKNAIKVSWSRFDFKGTYYTPTYQLDVTDSSGNPIPNNPIRVNHPTDNTITTINHKIEGLMPNKQYIIKATLAYGDLIDNRKERVLNANTQGDHEQFIFDSTTGVISGYTPEYLNDTSLKELIIPEQINGVQITRIAKNAFIHNETITKVVMPNTITHVGENAFFDCKKIQEIVFSTNLTTIEYGAFAKTSIKQLSLPNTLTKIGASAFHTCAQLESLNLPDSVTELGNQVFANCSKMTSLKLSNNLTTIPEFAFINIGITNLNIPNSVKQLDGHCFSENKNLKNVNLSSNLEIIGSSSFTETLITSINIPSSVKRIESDAFALCKSLNSVTLNEGLEYIGKETFADCHQLNFIKLPNSITSIDWEAFSQKGKTDPLNMVVKLPNKATPPSIINNPSTDPDAKSVFYKVKEIQIPRIYEVAYRNELTGKYNSPTIITTY